MKLTVLVDNNTLIDQYYYGEPGVCYYIEDDDIKLLLDVGYSDVFIKNAELLGIDLNLVSTIAISHGHNDHTRGLVFFAKQFALNKVKIVAHPHTFQPRIESNLQIGSPLSSSDLQQMSQLSLSTKPQKLSKNLIFLGEIPSLTSFERRAKIGTILNNDQQCDDYVVDDSAIVYQSDKGLFIITGCSHSGICNIIEYAKQVFKDDRVLGVIGGFHLFDVSQQLLKTIDYFKQNNIAELYPCHCVSFKAKSTIHQAIPIHEVGVGLTLQI